MPEKAAFFHFYSAIILIPCEISRLIRWPRFATFDDLLVLYRKAPPRQQRARISID